MPIPEALLFAKGIALEIDFVCAVGLSAFGADSDVGESDEGVVAASAGGEAVGGVVIWVGHWVRVPQLEIPLRSGGRGFLNKRGIAKWKRCSRWILRAVEFWRLGSAG